ncbi:MAG TPA: hypothetical protein VFD32_11375, partial [Dehalococcoidia bacterium]|nr:hypothetical protein [Dehalococcoidia bacterium]
MAIQSQKREERQRRGGTLGESVASGSDLLEIYRSSGTATRLAELQELVQPTLEMLAGALGYDRAFVCLIDGGRISGMVGI